MTLFDLINYIKNLSICNQSSHFILLHRHRKIEILKLYKVITISSGPELQIVGVENEIHILALIINPI